ncbi:hypothetical protein N7499_002703 [Penicillium canescens]|uniref:Uncharacterized protein n=1 Tax=Penicillium canescens TaxID=5083 RepID=A0AAD6I8D7_PENCN|nr:uncharacterized protein N7446_010340 [Penicillium canescens]KAJ6001383.1 hypothetical protein N7522_006610 [Penicillium canescens]KAJ6035578.1 hypothetical protein N7460_009753 [Penicillium canescens]KAJ6037701.1 hypothetical protein N7444_010406 [Penicillium canescens]KAJ6054328.1 hypothetical protein N7446_010340 [Penicillium canescens]KAJ6098329.1 hypothetical protein N7499_002703 [Penicillium canescens]
MEVSKPDAPTADSTLEALGYTAELSRNRSTWQVVFMCFILASVPYGLSTTMSYALIGGGSANMIWGWIVVSLIMMCVGASLAEITSVYPTAGGVYYQTFALSPAWCRRATAWVCGWSFVAGNITITLAVNFATALFFVECLNVFEDSTGTGIAANMETYQTYLIFVAITVLCHAIPTFGNRWLTHIETFAIFWTIVGVTAILITILVVAHSGRRSAEFVFTSFEPQSGWPDGWSFCIGLLQAAYGLSATGMVTSMCEEVRQPAIQVPRAIVGGVALNALAGFAFLIPIAFVLPDVAMLAALPSAQPVPTIVKSATGNSAGAFCLLIPLIVLGLICGIGCVTATSRITWAFARDGAIPGSGWWKTVNGRLQIPLNSLLLGMVIELLLGLIYFGSSAAFSAFSGVGVIFLTMSYACPVAVSLILRRRKDLERGSYNLGLLGTFCNVVCIAWCLLAIPLFSMPTSIPVTKDTMNYACVVFVGFVVISGVWYGVWGKKNYIGPALEEIDGQPGSQAGDHSDIDIAPNK